MKLWQVDYAVTDMCEQVANYVKVLHWEDMDEKSILRELIICILGSGVRYELAAAYADEILSNPTFISQQQSEPSLADEISSILSLPTYCKIEKKQYTKYRYPKRGAKHVARSIKSIRDKHSSIKKLLKKKLDTRHLRKELIILCPGIGPKQGSHFLKNIGYTEDIAVLDRHIVRYMEAAEKNEICKRTLSRLDNYELVEKRFQKITEKFSHSPSIVDQSMWFIMRAIGNEAIT